MHKKHVLILGASGFVGTEVLRQLAQAEDHFRISVLTHKKNLQLPSNIKEIKGSLNNFDLSVLREDTPDIIFHFARVSSSRFRKAGRLWAALKGYFANKRLLKFLAETGKEVSIVYLSGSLMYGKSKNGGLHDEQSPLQPTSFAREYVLAEKPLLQFSQHQKITVTLVRAPWIFGNGSWFKTFYLDTIKKKQTLYSYSPDDFRMMLIDVEDCARALINIPQLKHHGVINLFMNDIVFYKDFIDTIYKAAKNVMIQKIPGQELKDKYENAVYEAFNDEILMGTLYPQYSLQKYFKYKDALQLVEERLAFFLKNK